MTSAKAALRKWATAGLCGFFYFFMWPGLVCAGHHDNSELSVDVCVCVCVCIYKRDLSYSDLEEAYGGNKMLSLCVVFRFDHYKNICKENAEKIPNSFKVLSSGAH